MEAYEVLYNAYISLDKHDDAVEYGKKCLHIAKEAGNKKDEMFAHLLLGKIYLCSTQLNIGFLHIKEGLNIAEELKHDEAKREFTEIRVVFYGFVGMHEKVDTYDVPVINKVKDAATCSEKDLLDAVEQAMKTAKNKGGQILSLFRLYNYYLSKHQYKQAIDILERMKEVHNSNDLKLLCCREIGDLYMRMKQYKRHCSIVKMD
jgi:hypothetical protein